MPGPRLLALREAGVPQSGDGLRRVRHPSLWLFLQKLQKLLRLDEAELEATDSGQPVTKPGPAYRRRSHRMTALAQNFPVDDAGRLRYLKSMAHAHRLD